MLEVEEAHGGRLLAAAPVDGERHTVRQVLVDSLVACQAGGINPLQVEDDPLRLIVGHPRIETFESRYEPAGKQHIPLVVALASQHLAGDVGPAEPLQQFESGLLGQVELVKLGGPGYGCSSASSSRITMRRPGRSRG